jgi:tRNA 5-methylaminomethyl-2-thiouridine biosynthesis bifunctional protein
MQFAQIEWRENNGICQPYSLDFNDVYFNSESGLQETEYVFIAHNQLQQRFSDANLTNFTIVETGFGTGLNFLAVSAVWLKLAPKNAILHYIGIEKTPLSLADLKRAHHLWPQFASLSCELAAEYSTVQTGCNVFTMAASRIQLTLWLNDIHDVLPNVQIADAGWVDAWLLDGFAPSKNADMWSMNVFTQMARLSNLNTTFATFTSAGNVRRGLQATGFKVTKHKGFGKKREMLSGIFVGSNL